MTPKIWRMRDLDGLGRQRMFCDLSIGRDFDWLVQDLVKYRENWWLQFVGGIAVSLG